MPRLTFPFLPDGLLVPTLVGLGAAAMQNLLAQGKPLPAPLHVRGQLDSGSALTAVAPWLLSALNAVPGPIAQTQTVTGSVSVRFYQISFSIHHLGGGAVLHRGDWTVTNLIENPDDVDILFGLDLHREIVVTIDGPGQSFSLDF
jgi:hypothetical protein